MARPLRLDEVRGFTYVNLDSGSEGGRLSQMRSNLRNDWGFQTPIASCARCGRYTNDSSRDFAGMPLHENPEDVDEVVCSTYLNEALRKAEEQNTLALLEEKLGLTEENKKTLQALMSIIDNPDRVMMVARVQGRVDELERRLEDRTEGIRDAVESKMENANSRLFVSSLIGNVALFAAGLFAGIIIALVLGG